MRALTTFHDYSCPCIDLPIDFQYTNDTSLLVQYHEPLLAIFKVFLLLLGIAMARKISMSKIQLGKISSLIS